MAKDRIVFANIVIFLAYVVTGGLSLQAGNIHEFVTLIWPPAGIAVAGVVLFGPRVLPSIALGALFTGFPVETSTLAVIGTSLGNTLEPLVTANILRRLRFVSHLGCSRSVLILFCAATLAATVAATCGTLSLWASSIIDNGQLENTWWKWWFGDVLGIIVMTPLILSWAIREPSEYTRYHIFELLAFLGVFSLACAFVLFDFLPAIGKYVTLYAFFPALVWAATRFGKVGVTTYIFLVAAVAIGSVLLYQGPSAGPRLTDMLVHTQAFVLALSFTGLTLVAFLSELKVAQATIRQRQVSLEELVKQRTMELTNAIEELERNQFFLSQSQNIAKIGSYRWNVKNDTVKWTPELFSIFEIDPTVFDGKLETYLNLIPQPDQSRIERTLRECVRERKGFVYEHVIYTPSGTKKIVHCQGATVIDENNDFVEMIGTAQDITETKLIEEELQRAKQAAEEANRAKSSFLANMSHEIRTPLGIILGFTELLSDSSLPEQERMSYVRTIQKNGIMLSELISDVLDLSKIESGKVQTEIMEVPLLDLLLDTRHLMEPKAVENGLELRFSFREKVPTRIYTDPTALRQIFVNLIGNAIKFTPHGKIEIRTRTVSQKGRTFLAFDIADTGVGLTPDQRERLFKPFMQADTSTTRKFGGSGLGLFLSKSLAEALGGSLKIISSRPGKGTVFRVTIDPGPLSGRVFLRYKELPEVPPAPAKAPPVAKELQGKNVLLVEDSIDNQRLVTKFLNAAGAHVDVASNGMLGLEAALKYQYDVVLMDIQMPLMDGYEATRRLRERGYTDPIIALTAHAMVEERERCLRSGFSDYLSKPISRSELIEHIAKS